MNSLRAACFGAGLVILAGADNLITAIVGGLLLGSAIFMCN